MIDGYRCVYAWVILIGVLIRNMHVYHGLFCSCMNDGWDLSPVLVCFTDRMVVLGCLCLCVGVNFVSCVCVCVWSCMSDEWDLSVFVSLIG